MSLHLEIVTPRGSVVKKDVDEVVLPGKLGELGVLSGHIPLLAALKAGVLRYKSGQETIHLAIRNGFVEVEAEDKVLVLTDAHVFANDVDLDQSQLEWEELTSELSQWNGELDTNYQKLYDQMEWVQARIKLGARK